MKTDFADKKFLKVKSNRLKNNLIVFMGITFCLLMVGVPSAFNPTSKLQPEKKDTPVWVDPGCVFTEKETTMFLHPYYVSGFHVASATRIHIRLPYQDKNSYMCRVCNTSYRIKQISGVRAVITLPKPQNIIVYCMGRKYDARKSIKK